MSHAFATLSGLVSVSAFVAVGYLLILMLPIVVALCTRDQHRRRTAMKIVELLTRRRS